MNYSQIYKNLIDFRKQNSPNGYVENHHILPKSMGGTDDKNNLVGLTGREHWIAHLLLWKIHKNSQCLHACHMMAMRCEERGIPQIHNSRMYQLVRIQHALNVGSRMQLNTGSKNSQFGTFWINDGISKSRKISNAENIPTGWFKGRIVCPKNYALKREIAKKIQDKKIARIELIKKQRLVKNQQDHTSRGYRKKATDLEIVNALKECEFDIQKAKAYLGYQLRGGNSTVRFEKILYRCRP